MDNEATRLAQEAPGRHEWLRKQKSYGIHDSTEYAAVIRGLVRPQEHAPSGGQGVEDIRDTTLIAVARSFSAYVSKTSRKSDLLQACLSFQRLLLFSLGLLLLHRRNSWREVNRITEWTAPQERTRRQCLQGVKWVHKAIVDLHTSHGWSIEAATQLFFLVPLLPTRLINLRRCKTSDLTGQVEQPDTETCMRTSFSIPALLWEICSRQNLLQEIPSFTQICKVLGYANCKLPHQDSFAVVKGPDSLPAVPVSFQQPESFPDVSHARSTNARPVGDNRKRPNEQRHDKLPRKARCSSRVQLDVCQANKAVNYGDRAQKEANMSGATSWRAVFLDHSPGGTDTDPRDDRPTTLRDLLQHMGSSGVPMRTLRRGTRPQRRWSADGHIIEAQLNDNAISPESALIFRDQSALDEVVRAGLDSGILRECGEQNDMVAAPLRVQPSRLAVDAVVLICHVFPLQEALERGSTEVVNDLLPILEEWAGLLRGADGEVFDLPPTVRESLVETYLAAANRRNHAGLLETAEVLAVGGLSHPLSLEMAATRSRFARQHSNFSASDKIIDDALGQTGSTSSILAQSHVVDLQLSKAENAMFKKEYTRALEVCSSACPDADLEHEKVMSPLEFHAMRKRQTVLGRAFHNLGNFEMAYKCFIVCKNYCEENSNKVLPHLTRHLANTLMERGRHEEAELILSGELRCNERQPRAYRRLRLCHASALLELRCVTESRKVFQDVDNYFNQSDPQTQNDKLDHLHARLKLMVIALRAQQWDGLQQLAGETLQLIRRYGSFPTANYYERRVLLLKAGAQCELARLDLRSAAVCQDTPLHFVPGVGTYERIEQDEWLHGLGFRAAHDYPTLGGL